MNGQSRMREGTHNHAGKSYMSGNSQQAARRNCYEAHGERHVDHLWGGHGKTLGNLRRLRTQGELWKP